MHDLTYCSIKRKSLNQTDYDIMSKDEAEHNAIRPGVYQNSTS
jgi:hypothetical protein